MNAVLCIDDAVGERRRLLLDERGAPFRLDIERWSERNARVVLGEVRWGRVTARVPGNRGWFVDLGLGAHGVVEPTKAARVAEGAMLAFRVKAEAWGGKGPLLALADMSPKFAPPDQPALAASAEDTFLAGISISETLEGQAARERVEAALDDALHPIVQLAGGGDIAIEAARGATMIDVDAGQRVGNDAERFALALNLDAADAAARQLSLRGIGGLVLVDFVGMAQADNRRAVAERFREALTRYLGRKSEVLELSRLNVCEAAIARRTRPVSEAIAASPCEREALDALRMIETARWQDRAGRIAATVSPAAAAWLEQDRIGWREALAGRIGGRWTIKTSPGHSGRPDVRSAP